MHSDQGSGEREWHILTRHKPSITLSNLSYLASPSSNALLAPYFTGVSNLTNFSILFHAYPTSSHAFLHTTEFPPFCSTSQHRFPDCSSSFDFPIEKLNKEVRLYPFCPQLPTLAPLTAAEGPTMPFVILRSRLCQIDTHRGPISPHLFI